MTEDELIGRVMMEMIASVGMEDLTPDDNHALNVMARAAIAVALEEAATLADRFPARAHGNLATTPHAAAEQAGNEIAAAIRALKDNL